MIPVAHPAVVPPLLDQEFRAQPSPADPDAAWGSFAGKSEVTAALTPVQRDLCCYCEETLGRHGSHIDHVVPKSKDHAGTFCFQNLVLSCITSGELQNLARRQVSCGHYRLSEYDAALFIKPTEPDCGDYFSCKENGDLQRTPGLPANKAARADYMIRELNLNTTRLSRRREDWLKAVRKQMAAMGYQQDAIVWFFRDCLREGKPFVSVIREYFGWIQ